MAIDYQYFEFRAFEYLIRLKQLWESEQDIPRIGQLLDRIREEEELIRTRRFRVAVVGEFKKGKSSFINALLGKEILPVDTLPTTATLNRITYGPVPKAYLIYKDGSREDVRIEELSAYVTKLTGESADHAARIAEAVVEYPSIFCQNHVDLIDTPGMNDDISMNDVTLAQLEQIDLAIVTLSPGSPFSGTESMFMMRLLESDEICQIVVVVTKIDEVRGEANRKKIMDFLARRIPEQTLLRLREHHEEGDPVYRKFDRIFQELPIFGVCSLDALDARQYNDEELFARSGFVKLNDSLPGLILASQNNSTVLRAVNTVRRSAKEYEAELPKLLVDYEEKKQSVREERNAFAALCYGTVGEESAGELADRLQKRLETFLNKERDEVCRDFIRCLSSIQVLDAKVIEDGLKEQADVSLKRMNDQICGELEPSLKEVMREEAMSRIRELMGRMGPNAAVSHGMEKAREQLQEFSLDPPDATAELPDMTFSWLILPVPSGEALLRPDLILWIREAVERCFQDYYVRRSGQLRQIAAQAGKRVLDCLEPVVVGVFRAGDCCIQEWDRRQERLKSPELLEQLRQITEENESLEEAFLEQLKDK